MTAICCADSNMGIGKGNMLPWPKNKEDLNFFKSITLNKKILVGRKTFEGLPPLKNREIYVLSRRRPGILDGLNQIWPDVKFSNVADNVHFIYTLSEIPSDCIVCGGAEIYQLLWDKIGVLYLTILNKEYDCDTYFPVKLEVIEEKFRYKELQKEIDGGRIWKYYNLIKS